MKIIKNKFFLIGLAAVIILGAVYFIFAKEPKIEYTTVSVYRGDLVQTVSETGTVKSNNEVELNFPASGKIVNIFVKVGDEVKKDQVLAELDNSDLELKAREAKANLNVAIANLAKLKAGSTASELVVSQANVDQAKTAYQAAEKELEKTRNTVNESIRQAQKNLDDLYVTAGNDITSYQRNVTNYKAVALTAVSMKISVINNALDNINTILLDDDAENYLSAKNKSLIETTKNSHNSALPFLDAAEASLKSAEADQSRENATKALTDALSALNKAFTALKDCYAMLEATVAGGNFSQADLDAYKTAVNTQQTNISAGITSVQTAQTNYLDSINDLNNEILSAKNDLATVKVEAEQKITVAESKVETSLRAWQLNQAELDKLKGGARREDISLAEAQIDQAKAALELINNQISNNIIKAPSDGIITKKNYESGEQASGAKAVFSLLSASNFEIEVDVSEADINKIALNNPAEITLDAFGEDVKFQGKVNFIEPAETIIQDVIYYKVKINFDGQGKNIKSGMTANANITTARKDDALIMPLRAVIEKKGAGRIVRSLVNKKEVKEAPVVLGLRGDDGLAEVLSGVNEGDEVITYVKQGK